MQLFGLAWARADPNEIERVREQLVSQQRQDGGWAQIPNRDSDAYATGQALVALNQAGRLSPEQPAFIRGTEFLLSTQKPDGSWLVETRRTRAPGLEYFESGFPSVNLDILRGSRSRPEVSQFHHNRRLQLEAVSIHRLQSRARCSSYTAFVATPTNCRAWFPRPTALHAQVRVFDHRRPIPSTGFEAPQERRYRRRRHAPPPNRRPVDRG
jgi:Squalene-hopene cyclase N-terminal domain